MKVVLAGYNVDSSVLEDLRKNSPPREDASPETLSAAYARISRNPKPADELRALARSEVEKARRSNRTIIFRMGHHSVAEHAVFNFDIIGASRLAIEEIEKFRLCSFTEKSQRYITLGSDFVIPEEIRNAGQEDLFVGMVRSQNVLYHDLYRRLKPYVFHRYKTLAANLRNRSILDGWAKEDARYVVSLATEGQLGLTLNARNLELMIRRLAAKDSQEVRTLSSRLYALAKDVAPSLILFTDATDYDGQTYQDFEQAAQEISSASGQWPKKGSRRAGRDVIVVDSTGDGDIRILAALLHTVSAQSYEECLNRISGLDEAEKKKLFLRIFRHMEFHDFPLREFEYADLSFDLVLSASCFAQLKRHRMATLTCQPYDPDLGVTIPPSFVEIGAEKAFLEMVDRTNDIHQKLKKSVGPAAAYVLTNAHRRRALIKLNVRELYHVSRLREDPTAQWEIRKIVVEMSRLASKKFPLACLLLGGKNSYPALYKKEIGNSTRMVPPRIFS